MSLSERFPQITSRTITVNGLNIKIAEAGDSGPYVLMAHGWPESWYSWRHQMVALAEAGYRVIAPDMPGYGDSDAPEKLEQYTAHNVSAILVGILDELGVDKAFLVSHDFGTIVCWTTVQLYPERFIGFAPTSVPYFGRHSRSPIDLWQERYGDNFYYILYHQEPGVAEAEYDADPEGLLIRMFQSPGYKSKEPQIKDTKRSAGGYIPRRGEPFGLPDWLDQEDFDYYVAAFKKAGFRGGVNYYRNFHRNWEFSERFAGKKVQVPTCFIAGSRDLVLAKATKEDLERKMPAGVEDLRGVHLIDNIGHWLQQESPDELNKLLIEFFDSFK
ncbi:MAG: alpha/beta hydrolase [Pseudohongiellaceae bacterium]|nr:alpha/beta hydrolase [Pseudohongiellaceae bacterium]